MAIASVDGRPRRAGLRNRDHFALDPISPTLPHRSDLSASVVAIATLTLTSRARRRAASHRAKSSAWSWVMINTWAPTGSRSSTSSPSTARCTVTSAAPAVTSASRSWSSCSARESTRCSATSSRDRIRASSKPTWPTPKIATVGRTGNGSSSSLHLAAAALPTVLVAGVLVQPRLQELRVRVRRR